MRNPAAPAALVVSGTIKNRILISCFPHPIGHSSDYAMARGNASTRNRSYGTLR